MCCETVITLLAWLLGSKLPPSHFGRPAWGFEQLILREKGILNSYSWTSICGEHRLSTHFCRAIDCLLSVGEHPVLPISSLWLSMKTQGCTEPVLSEPDQRAMSKFFSPTSNVNWRIRPSSSPPKPVNSRNHRLQPALQRCQALTPRLQSPQKH